MSARPTTVRRPNRWPALKRRIKGGIVSRLHGAFGANLNSYTQAEYHRAKVAIRWLTECGCKVTLPRS